jgi:hypothetical protein
MSDRPAGAKPDHDVYTILVMVATVFVAAATVYLVLRSQQLFGTWNPFTGA